MPQIGMTGSLAQQTQAILSTDSTVENRVKHQIDHTKNNLGLTKDTLVLTAGVAGSAVAAKAVSKSKTAQNIISNALNNATLKNGINAIKESIKPYAKKATTFINGLPKPAKAVLLAGLAITGIAAAEVNNKYMYNAGKIDQKYEDKAKLDKKLND